MANDDYGYFGKGDTGYAQYMTAPNPPLRGWVGGGGRRKTQKGGGGGGGQRLRLPHRHCGGGRAGSFSRGGGGAPPTNTPLRLYFSTLLRGVPSIPPYPKTTKNPEGTQTQKPDQLLLPPHPPALRWRVGGGGGARPGPRGRRRAPPCPVAPPAPPPPPGSSQKPQVLAGEGELSCPSGFPPPPPATPGGCCALCGLVPVGGAAFRGSPSHRLSAGRVWLSAGCRHPNCGGYSDRLAAKPRRLRYEGHLLLL